LFTFVGNKFNQESTTKRINKDQKEKTKQSAMGTNCPANGYQTSTGRKPGNGQQSASCLSSATPYFLVFSLSVVFAIYCPFLGLFERLLWLFLLGLA